MSDYSHEILNRQQDDIDVVQLRIYTLNPAVLALDSAIQTAFPTEQPAPTEDPERDEKMPEKSITSKPEFDNLTNMHQGRDVSQIQAALEAVERAREV